MLSNIKIENNSNFQFNNINKTNVTLLEKYFSQLPAPKGTGL